MLRRSRKSTTKIARPMAASAAATVKMKNTKIWPLMSPKNRENATKLKFTASSMSSMHMSSTMTFFLFRNTPATAIAKRTPESASTWVSEIMVPLRSFLRGRLDNPYAILGPHRDLLRDVLGLGSLAPAQGEDDRRHARHQQDDGRELRGIGIAREERRSQRAGVRVVERQLGGGPDVRPA